MPTIKLHTDEPGVYETAKREKVTIKASGWVKAYDNLSKEGGVTEYYRLVNYPPHRVMHIDGDVNYESPHGRV